MLHLRLKFSQMLDYCGRLFELYTPDQVMQMADEGRIAAALSMLEQEQDLQKACMNHLKAEVITPAINMMYSMLVTGIRWS